MADETSSESIGNIAGKPTGDVARGPESSTGGEGGEVQAGPRPGASTMSGAPPEGGPAEGGPTAAEIAAEHSDDPELARQGGDVQTEPL